MVKCSATFPLSSDSGWQALEVKQATSPAFQVGDVIAFALNPGTADANPIHQEPRAVEELCSRLGVACPKNEVIVPGALIIARCTGVALGILGDVMVRELRNVKFPDLVFSGEPLDIRLTLKEARKNPRGIFGFFQMSCAVANGRDSKPVTAEFVVFRPSDGIG